MTLGPLLMIALISAAGTVWHNHETRHWAERIALAQDSYAEHLALRANVMALFKQHGDALLFGDLDDGSMEAELERALAANLSRIRMLIAAEVALVGQEEVPELEHLARIEAKVLSLTQSLRSFSPNGAPIDTETRRERLVELMDRELDDRLSVRISEALAEEQEEVIETRAEAARFDRMVHRLVTGLVFVSLLVAATAMVVFRSFVLTPTHNLIISVSRFEAGDFEAVPPVSGVRELRQVSAVLGRMAALLRLRHASQEEQTKVLEAAVEERTSDVARMVTQMERGELARRRMMADVSHELRTPLTVILGEADVGLRVGKNLPEEYRSSLDRIRETAKHANAIVDDLLLIARQEAGKLRLDLAETDIGKLVTRTCALVHHPVAVDLPPVCLRARIDPVRIRQCLLALLQNAVRYGGAGITVSMWRDGACVRISVEDDGPGMSDAEKAEAFDRFFRGPNAQSSGVDGTGLGLPIVRAIAEAHGGRAELADRPGGGLKVSILLPADRAPVLVAARGAA